MEKGKNKVEPILDEEERLWHKALHDFDIITEQVFPVSPSSMLLKCLDENFSLHWPLLYLFTFKPSIFDGCFLFFLYHVCWCDFFGGHLCTMFMPFKLYSLWLNSLCYNYGQIWEELTHVKLILVRFLRWKSICNMLMNSEFGFLSLRGVWDCSTMLWLAPDLRRIELC